MLIECPNNGEVFPPYAVLTDGSGFTRLILDGGDYVYVLARFKGEHIFVLRHPNQDHPQLA